MHHFSKYCIIVFVIIIAILIVPLSCEMEPSQSPDFTGLIDSIVDIDGNTYKTIGIGSQIWTAENIRVTRLSDGTDLKLVTSNTEWRSIDPTPSYCYYDNDLKNKNTLGCIYNFYAVETSMVCPDGWHVPSLYEWEILINFLGGSNVAGGKLKDFYSNLWASPNYAFSNNLRFLAKPAGYRQASNGAFSSKGTTSSWWTSTAVDFNHTHARSKRITNENTEISSHYLNKSEGMSVRCIKNKQ